MVSLHRVLFIYCLSLFCYAVIVLGFRGLLQALSVSQGNFGSWMYHLSRVWMRVLSKLVSGETIAVAGQIVGLIDSFVHPFRMESTLSVPMHHLHRVAVIAPRWLGKNCTSLHCRLVGNLCAISGKT